MTRTAKGGCEMKINKVDLQKALEIVKPGLASKEIIEQSTSFAFIKGHAVTYNDEISISHPIDNLKIEGAIKAEELYQLLNKITTEEIEIEISDKEIILKAGRGKAGLVLQQEIKLPLEKIDNKGWKDLPEGFIEAIKFVSFCCSPDMSRPILTCIHIRKDGIIEACDNFRAVWYQIDKLLMPSFLLPNSSTQHLIKHNIMQIKTTKGWVHFKTKEDTIFSCRIFDDNYVDTSNLFDLSKKTNQIKFPKTIAAILGRARVFAKQDHSLDEEVQLNIADNKLTIKSKGASGWFEESANIRYDKDPITISINPSFLEDSIEKIKHCYIGKDKIKFQGENWEHIIALI